MLIRVAGILIENRKILLLDQDVNVKRSWSLPGGKVEFGESLSDALIREFKEETGLEVKIQRMLYVCDNITSEKHVLHISFEVKRIDGELGVISVNETNKIRQVVFIDINKLTELGFNKKFQDIITTGFPAAGSYMGAKSNIGL